MGCCCCPARETFGATTLWLVEKATGDIVWRRSAGDESGGGGSHAVTLMSHEGFLVADKPATGVSGVTGTRVQHYSRDDVYMDLERAVVRSDSDGNSIDFAWGATEAATMGNYSSGGNTMEPQFWYVERNNGDPRWAFLREWTASGARRCAVSDGNFASWSITGDHETPIPIERTGGTERVYTFIYRTVGTPSESWVMNRRTWTGSTNSEIWSLSRGFVRTGETSIYGRPFSRGTTVYALDSNGTTLTLRTYNAYTGTLLSTVTTGGAKYVERGWVSPDGAKVVYFDSNRANIKILDATAGTVLGSQSVTGMSSGTGPEVFYIREGGDMMLTTQWTFPSSGRRLQRLAPDGTEIWHKGSSGSNEFGGMNWPIGDLTLGFFGLLEADGEVRWKWRNVSTLKAAYDLDDLILCAGQMGA